MIFLSSPINIKKVPFYFEKFNPEIHLDHILALEKEPTSGLSKFMPLRIPPDLPLAGIQFHISNDIYLRIL
jgi:hypothetical protein